MWKTVFFVSCFVLLVSGDQKPLNSIYANAVRCNYSAEYVYQNCSCFAKSYNRSFSTVNILATFKKPMTAYLSIKLFYKYGMIYREVIGSPLVDVCTVTSPAFSNKWIKMVVDMINDSVPGIFHKCPYTSIYVRNANVKTQSIPSSFPSGDYRLIVYFNGNSETNLMTINMMGTLTSDLKENFG